MPKKTDKPRQKIDVCYFQRRPRPGSNFSMETIFNDVRDRLRDHVNAQVKVCRRYNDGFLTKVFNTLEAGFRQTPGINHVTGEVHFLNLLMRRKTVVLTILDCGFMERKKGISNTLVKWLYLDAPVKRSRVVTAISEKTKEEIIRYTRCDPEKIKVIPVAIDDQYRPFPKEFNTANPTILQIGTGYNKNIFRLAASLSGIKCKLVIVGKLSTPQIDALRAHEVQYESLYNLSKQEMLSQYQRCDIVSFVSTFEGFGMPIVEANAVGRAVITSNVSSMPEVAGNAACLVDPFDVVSIRQGFEKVISDTEFRQRLIENGKSNQKRFDGDRIASEYLSLYKMIARS